VTRTPYGGTCPWCGARSCALLAGVRAATTDAAGAWDFAQCAACELVWLDPPPTPAERTLAYSSYYTHGSGTNPPATMLAAYGAAVLHDRYGYRGIVAGGAARWLARLGVVRDAAASAVMYLPALPGGRLLDVGCGNGAFLQHMQTLGWDVAGIEPDAAAVGRAGDPVRAAIHTGTLDDAPYSPASFDAITLHHVIEHVDDPVATLAACARLLARGGRLVALTPNVAALGRRVFGRRWLHWDPPRHRFLFTRRSLSEAARRAGLRVEELRTTARAARWTWRASRGRAGSMPGRARGAGAVLFQVIEHALLPLGIGEELLLRARRADDTRAAMTEP
jgi:2-polyprenyl-3-methyl-5-hydroxy-6-metoxy-1,4-benzoquinol methylase